MIAVDNSDFIDERMTLARANAAKSRTALQSQYAKLEAQYMQLEAQQSADTFAKRKEILGMERTNLEQQKKFCVGWFFFFDTVRSICATTTTDADGNFRITLPPDKVCHLVCTADRAIVGEVEKYYWVVAVPKGDTERMLLSNENMLR